MTRFSLCFHPSACLLSNSSLFSLTRSFQDHLLPESFPSSPSLNLVLLLFVSVVLLDYFRLSTYHAILIVCFPILFTRERLEIGGNAVFFLVSLAPATVPCTGQIPSECEIINWPKAFYYQLQKN